MAHTPSCREAVATAARLSARSQPTVTMPITPLPRARATPSSASSPRWSGGRPAESCADVQRLDAALAAACRDLAAAYGYDADPRYHPQSLDTTAFKA